MDVSQPLTADPEPEVGPVDERATMNTKPAKASTIVLVVGWLGVLTGLGLTTAAAQIVDHPTIQGRFLPVFWVGPVLTVFTAVRKRPHVVALSALSTLVLAIGAAIDLGHRHPIAGRYEFWLAASALLVTLAGWLSLRSKKPDRNLFPS
jgi:hypothetical protein